MGAALEAESIVATAERLQHRITERFPNSGLSQVAHDLIDTARETAARVQALAEPDLGLRILAGLVIAAGIGAQIYVAGLLDWGRALSGADALGLTQALDSVVNLLVLAFAALWFVVTLEQRLKRRRTLRELYELRSLAHVIDMHQLTKDPTMMLSGASTPSSPPRRMSEFELSRYLDYCTEMLALISKLAALYAGRSDDPAVIAAVNDLEQLTSNLGGKIWQKIMIISRLDEKRMAARPT